MLFVDWEVRKPQPLVPWNQPVQLTKLLGTNAVCLGQDVVWVSAFFWLGVEPWAIFNWSISFSLEAKGYTTAYTAKLARYSEFNSSRDFYRNNPLPVDPWLSHAFFFGVWFIVIWVLCCLFGWDLLRKNDPFICPRHSFFQFAGGNLVNARGSYDGQGPNQPFRWLSTRRTFAFASTLWYCPIPFLWYSSQHTPRSSW